MVRDDDQWRIIEEQAFLIWTLISSSDTELHNLFNSTRISLGQMTLRILQDRTGTYDLPAEMTLEVWPWFIHGAHNHAERIAKYLKKGSENPAHDQLLIRTIISQHAHHSKFHIELVLDTPLRGTQPYFRWRYCSIAPSCLDMYPLPLSKTK